jgi:hypothetical protein
MEDEMSSTDAGMRGEAGQRFAFIVGAPRCGTTALSRYLKEHPSVCFSRTKEPHYFAQHDLRGFSDSELRERVTGDYLQRFFPHCHDPDAMLAEGSVTYLYAPLQMEPVLRTWPEAKFILTLRDPMDMLPSLHHRLLFIGDERETDFARAWALVDTRRKGEAIPRGCVDPRWLDYRRAGELGNAVEQFFDAVGRERCFISLYDDFAADPAGQYRALLKFLGLPDDGRTDFRPERTRRGYKIAWLQRFLKRPPKAAVELIAPEGFALRSPESVPKTKRGIRKGILNLRKRILKWNVTEAPAVVLPPGLRQEIHDAFAEDVAKLGRLIGRDLSHWLQVEPNANANQSSDHRSRAA